MRSNSRPKDLEAPLTQQEEKNPSSDKKRYQGSDEIEELKKIFFEFFVEDTKTDSEANHNEQRYYDRSSQNNPVIEIMH
jgi:hypothetical protein